MRCLPFKLNHDLGLTVVFMKSPHLCGVLFTLRDVGTIAVLRMTTKIP